MNFLTDPSRAELGVGGEVGRGEEAGGKAS